MKKVITLLMVFLTILALAACGRSNAPSTTSTPNPSSTPIPTSTPKPELSSTEIENIVVKALYDKIKSTYPMADAGSCRYSINKTEKSGSYYYVYGSVTLYDKYGKTTGGWSDGSGTPFRSFTVKMNEDGRFPSCTIK
jgi:curli biogenesis system outer membrane secretion channel CsgG